MSLAVARPRAPLDIADVRARLDGESGPGWWRSLEEVAGTPEFRDFLHREIPSVAKTLDLTADRRATLKMMAASLLVGGLAGCDDEGEFEKHVAYVYRPEHVIPSVPAYYATAVTHAGYATAVLGETHTGRPTRLEGNPRHPVSRGAIDPIAQAQVLDLYGPERLGGVRSVDGVVGWERFLQRLAGLRETWARDGGRGLRLLTGATASPSLIAGIEALLADLPEARWHVHEPFETDAAHEGARLAFGRPLEPRLRLAEADRVLSLDADALGQGHPGQLLYARDLAEARRIRTDRPPARLWAVESTPTLTGAAADERIARPAHRVEAMARYLARAVGLEVPGGEVSGDEARFLDRAAADLRAHRSRAPVIAGEAQPAAVHALVAAVNAHLANTGVTLDYVEPVRASGRPGVAALAEDMAAGDVSTLVVIDANPVRTAPADLGFDALMDRVALKVHLGARRDETALACDWHVPRAHELESWGDARALDGTVTIQQPLIRPLTDGRTPQQLVAALAGDLDPDARGLVWRHWETHGEGDRDAFWRAALIAGFVEGSAAGRLAPEPREGLIAALPAPGEAGQGVELQIRPDPATWDGRFNDNAWLQELPRPLTKLVWTNAAMVAPATAERLGLEDGQIVRLVRGGAGPSPSAEVAVHVLPGQPDGSVALTPGYGGAAVGRIGRGMGYDVQALIAGATPYRGGDLRVEPTEARVRLVTTQHHHAMEGRALVRSASWAHYADRPDFAKGHHREISLYPEPGPGVATEALYQWGMVVDTGACIGCNACVVACQAENNTPVVGPEEVARGREMHWIRVDRWYAGDLDAPETLFQPVMCQHCENAPCEYVCPVGATQHSSEGLNVMVYNRCIGTRYCSQNCPYKVRRFNWFDYTGEDAGQPSPPALMNPDVTVRSRGVMEKCTYCVQRIEYARAEAEANGHERIRGEVRTACQAACPTRAITFGDLNDPTSAVAKAKREPREYALLGELNVRPRTTYLARVRHPDTAEAAEEAAPETGARTRGEDAG
ncbi:MAG: TAT-variant-translocated molybdopterin oxidoreductase [Paracoccaceae bacterium]